MTEREQSSTGAGAVWAAASGWWRSQGYGWWLHVSDDGFAIYDDCDRVLTRVDGGSRAELALAFDGVRLDSNLDELSLCHAGDVTRYRYQRSASAPSLGTSAAPASDPLHNFDALWNTFQEHYAFFPERSVDWSAVRVTYRDVAARCVTDGQLLTVLGDAVSALQDNHVSIASPLRTLQSGDKLATHRRQLCRDFQVRPWTENRHAYLQSLQRFVSAAYLGGRGTIEANGLLQWGRLAGDIGYLNVMGEFGYAPTDVARSAQDLPRTRVAGATFLQQECAALTSAMDRALLGMASTRALILDLRLNFGGYDRLSLDIVARFISDRSLAYSKAAMSSGMLLEPQCIFARHDAQRPSYHKPLYVLISPHTASAGEILVLALMHQPHVTLVGQPTLGILSDNLYKRLPNGWEVSLSNERYLDALGVCHEVSGIQPQVSLPMYPSDDLRTSMPALLERTRQLAASQRAP